MKKNNLLLTLLILPCMFTFSCNKGGQTSSIESLISNSDTSTEETVDKSHFSEDTVFYLDCASVPTFGAGFESNSITFKKDGTFYNDYTLSAAGVVLVNIFMDNEGTYTISEDSKSITMHERFDATSNQDPSRADEMVDMTWEIVTLDDNSLKFVAIFNDTLELPYYTNPEKFDSLKEFEYPEVLGEKVVFSLSQNFIGYVDENDETPYGVISEYTLELTDTGEYTQSLTLVGTDATNKLTTKGAYKLNDATNPTEITLLEEGKELESAIKYAINVVTEEDSTYYTMTYTHAIFGSFLAYSDIDKMPTSDVFPTLLGESSPFSKATSFSGTCAFGEITFNFRRNGVYEMTITAFGLTYKGHYKVIDNNTKIMLLEDPKDGVTQTEEDILTYDITKENDLMSFTYTANETTGPVVFAETVANVNQ